MGNNLTRKIMKKHSQLILDTINLPFFVVFDIKCNFSDFSNMAVVTGIHTWDIDFDHDFGFFFLLLI